jgi:hypothetical protein
VRADFKSATALSVAAGESTAAQDLHWLEKNIPCQAACPAGTDIPWYLEAIYHGRFAEAYEINLRDNVFPAVWGVFGLGGCLPPRLGVRRHLDPNCLDLDSFRKPPKLQAALHRPAA